jgi:hypothetical protein
MRRRTLLAALAASVPLAGCGSDAAFDDEPANGSTDPPPTQSFTRSGPGTALRCRGEPVAVERAIRDESGYDDDIEYFASNETVRFVARRSGGDPAWFETMPFDEWGAIQCAEAGRDRVRTVTAERLNTQRFEVRTGDPPGGDTSQPVVTLSVTTRIGPDGQRSTPPFPVARLAANAPQSVDATVSVEGDTVSRTIPVYAAHRTIEAG